MTTISIFDPTAPERTQAHAKPRTLESLQGKVVGFIDNAKPNFNYLADDLAELLLQKYGVKSIVKHRKPTAGMPASAEIIKDIIQQCDLLITGSGD